jgi:hypothetical protein
MRHRLLYKQKRSLQVRLQRFELEPDRLEAIVRHSNSRCSCFWIGVKNISASGLGAEHLGLVYVPFSPGDRLDVTLDISCRVFSRPIHVKCIVQRREEQQKKINKSSTTQFSG